MSPFSSRDRAFIRHPAKSAGGEHEPGFRKNLIILNFHWMPDIRLRRIPEWRDHAITSFPRRRESRHHWVICICGFRISPASVRTRPEWRVRRIVT